MVSYDVYLRQCCDLLRLQAWYVWRLHVQRGLTHQHIFGNQLVRFLHDPIAAASEERWQALQHAVLDECARHGEDPGTGGLEESILGQVRGFVTDSYVRDGPYARYQANCHAASPYYGFTHDTDGDRLNLHFTNTVDPDSPLQHIPELRRGLAALLAEVRAGNPGLSVAYCGSWLNSVPRFTALFPAAWLAGAEASPPAGHGGWWGQFTDRTGALHQQNADYLRRTGQFRYPHLRCTCSVDDLAHHLSGLIS